MHLLPFSFPDWPYGGATCALRLYSNLNWIDEAGIPRLAGKPETNDFYQTFPGTVAGRVVSFANGLDTPSTTKALEHSATIVRVTGVLFDADNTPRKIVFSRWILPHDLDPQTYGQLAIYNKRRPRRLAARYLTADLIYAAIQEAIRGLTSSSRLPAETGIATLVDGQLQIASVHVTGTSQIQPFSISSGVTGTLYVPIDEIVPGVSFIIHSTNPADAGDVVWARYEP